MVNPTWLSREHQSQPLLRSPHIDTLAQDTLARIERVEALDDVHDLQCVGTPAEARAEEGESLIICPCVLRLGRAIWQRPGRDDQGLGHGSAFLVPDRHLALDGNHATRHLCR